MSNIVGGNDIGYHLTSGTEAPATALCGAVVDREPALGRDWLTPEWMAEKHVCLDCIARITPKEKTKP